MTNDDDGDSSRIPGFRDASIGERLRQVDRRTDLSPRSRAHLEAGGGLEPAVADRLSENVIAAHGLPLSIGLNFRINQRDVLVPMAIEEASVVAAASNAARLVRASGGFVGEATAPVMTAQVQIEQVPDLGAAKRALAQERDALLAAGDAAVPRLVERGGGCRDLEMRVLDESDGSVTVHVYIDVRDAMGANIANSVAEAVGPVLRDALGGRLGLRVLTNHHARRRVRVEATVPYDVLGGEQVGRDVARASRIAELDPLRAVTHNKGVMNGVDAVAVATGQDWRAVEAAAHADASAGGRYGPLATWRRSEHGLQGLLELPLAVGTVGGVTGAHPGVRAALEIAGVSSAKELAVMIGATGLATNLAALRALVTEGIQRGHMRLHERKNRADT